MKDLIFAIMVALVPPGVSIQSTVIAKRTDPPICSDSTKMICRKPWFSKRRKAWVLPEKKADAVLRYSQIAEIIDSVSTKHPKWPGSKTDLVHHLLTVARHESSFTRDVHDGSHRGDCDWSGYCKSSCLGQILVGRGRSRFTKYKHRDLVGLDKASTSRCIETMAAYLSASKSFCLKRKRGDRCTFGVYGGVRSPSTDKRIRAREQTLFRVRALHNERKGKTRPKAGRQR